jgi:16S rRNA (uracil1498-N3)-methyltransferase
VVRLDAERALKRAAHWQAIAAAACEQCGRNHLPRIEPVVAFMTWLAQDAGGAARLMLSPRAEQRLSQLGAPQGAVCLLAGPEGGLAPEEMRSAVNAGFLPVRLGPRILRTETAAVAAIAAMQALWGDF